MPTCWLIGSVRDLAAQVVAVNGHDHTITSGSRYLYHPTASLSLLAQIQAAMVAEGLAGASVLLLENRRVRISAAANFTLTWPVDGLLRSLLGFTSNLAAASSYTAPLVSRLLWSPGKTETPTRAPLGVVGHTTHQVHRTVSPFDGTTSTVVQGERTRNTFTWRMVANARVQTPAALGGEFATWWNDVGVKGSLWHLWRLVAERVNGSDPVTLSASLGPYVAEDTDWTFGRSQGCEWTDSFHPISIDCEVQAEYP